MSEDGTAPEPPHEPELSTVRAVPYKGADLDSGRGPGLGCFRFQLVLITALLIVTPLSVVGNAPEWLSAVLLFATLGLLLVAGQTIIFLLRLVAADRRGRRRPLASATPTVGELDDARAIGRPTGRATGDGHGDDTPEADESSVRQ